jgi:hypothetical protein
MTPATTKRIDVSRGECTNQVDAMIKEFTKPAYQDFATKARVDLPSIKALDHAAREVLVNRLIVFVTMHELGHATGAAHHAVDAYMKEPPVPAGSPDKWAWKYFWTGDASCPMRYWHMDPDKTNILKFLAGQWKLTAPPDGGQWAFCEAEDWPHMKLK